MRIRWEPGVRREYLARARPPEGRDRAVRPPAGDPRVFIGEVGEEWGEGDAMGRKVC